MSELQALPPRLLLAERLARALSSTGWEQVAARPGLYERWSLPRAEGIKILVPTDPARPDYADLMQEAWLLLTQLSARVPAALATITALSRAPGDEIKFRKEAVTIQGAVAWPDGEDLIASARNTLVAAAKTSLSRRSYYAQKHGRFAKRYLDSVLMGQTQVGSYVVTAYAPVDEIFEERPTPPGDTSGKTRLTGYRGREITETLTQALSAVEEATAHYASTASLSGFEDGVKSGISRDLTQAISGMLKHADASSIHIDWTSDGQQSLALPGAVTTERVTFVFEASALPVLERAGTRLAAMTSSEFVTVTGWVSVVSRPSRRQAGVIRLRVVRGSVARTLSLRLSKEQYQLAAAAVTDNALLRVVGRQEKEGSRYWLYDPSDIRVVEAPATVALPPRAEQLTVDEVRPTEE